MIIPIFLSGTPKTFVTNTLGKQPRIPHRPKNEILEQINRNASVRKKDELKNETKKTN